MPFFIAMKWPSCVSAWRSSEDKRGIIWGYGEMSKQDLEQKTELCEEDQSLARFEFLIKKKRQFMQEIAKIDGRNSQN